jgi:hypothetical protein
MSNNKKHGAVPGSNTSVPSSNNRPQGAGEQLSFLPPPPFCPTWPTRNTLADCALGELMNGKMIDHHDFEDGTQSWRLGAVIFNLRTLGWPVETIKIPAPTEQSPNRFVALYHLPSKYTALALAINGRPA